MRKYEAMVILNNNLEEEARVSLLDSLKAILTDNGANITKVDEWGSREFAYEIEKQTRGYYVVIEFETDNVAVNAEFVRLCEINANVVRELIVQRP